MDIGGLSLLIFIGIFSLLIILHELGHYIFARLGKIEVEEFGFGIPPRAMRLWRAKGSLQIDQHRIEIPRNFDLPAESQDLLGRQVEAIVASQENKLILQSIRPLASDDAPPAKIDSPNGNLRIIGVVKHLSPGTEFTLNALPLGGFGPL